MTHTSSFDITNAKQYFSEMLLPQYNDFLEKNSSSRHALLTTIIAYHLYEWVHGNKFTQASFNQEYPDNESMSDLFEVARNIANGTKHFSNKPVRTRTQSGFSSGFSDGFSRPLNIILVDGDEVSADKFLRQIVDFWKQQHAVGAF